MKRGKKYREANDKVDRLKHYPLDEGLELLHQLPIAKFDETVECAIRLGVNPKHADQMVRSTVVLPHGTGRSVRVLVFTSGENETIAKEAGADYVGADDLVKKNNILNYTNVAKILNFKFDSEDPEDSYPIVEISF